MSVCARGLKLLWKSAVLGSGKQKAFFESLCLSPEYQTDRVLPNILNSGLLMCCRAFTVDPYRGASHRQMLSWVLCEKIQPYTFRIYWSSKLSIRYLKFAQKWKFCHDLRMSFRDINFMSLKVLGWVFRKIYNECSKINLCWASVFLSSRFMGECFS